MKKFVEVIHTGLDSRSPTRELAIILTTRSPGSYESVEEEKTIPMGESIIIGPRQKIRTRTEQGIVTTIAVKRDTFSRPVILVDQALDTPHPPGSCLNGVYEKGLPGTTRQHIIDRLGKDSYVHVGEGQVVLLKPHR